MALLHLLYCLVNRNNTSAFNALYLIDPGYSDGYTNTIIQVKHGDRNDHPIVQK